jgi:hypothetical protein
MSMEQDDQAAAAVATAPRVTLDNIKASIAVAYFASGETIAKHSDFTDVKGKQVPFPPNLSVFTLCMIVMKNGYIVTGTSAPASIANYDQALGRKLAMDDAIRKIWPLMGFALRDVLHHDGQDQGVTKA